MSNNVKISSDGITCMNCGIDVSGGNIYTDTPENTDISNIVPTTKWVSDYVSSTTNVPIGGIIMWAGTTIPVSWALCDGTNGTPNLSGRFILGYDSGTYNLNDIGGFSSITLTVDEIPAHSHSVVDPGHNHNYNVTSDAENVSGDGSKSAALNELNNFETSNNTTGISLTQTGGGNSHENMPPYYVLAYIIKIS